MANSAFVNSEIEALKVEIAALRSEIAAGKSENKAVAEPQAETNEDSSIKVQMTELRDTVADFVSEMRKEVEDHPVRSTAAALALGVVLGRIARL